MARTVLLADDSVTAQNMGRRILMDAGYEVITVNNGSAALKKIHESKPDLIVLDVYMPGYGGLEVCQRLKETAETMKIPVLLTVGKMEPFKSEEAKRVRADAHIVKPFDAGELLAALTKLEDRIVPSAEGRNGKPRKAPTWHSEDRRSEDPAKNFDDSKTEQIAYLTEVKRRHLTTEPTLPKQVDDEPASVPASVMSESRNADSVATPVAAGESSELADPVTLATTGAVEPSPIVGASAPEFSVEQGVAPDFPPELTADSASAVETDSESAPVASSADTVSTTTVEPSSTENRSRWVAENVPLTAEEASLELEHEMHAVEAQFALSSTVVAASDTAIPDSASEQVASESFESAFAAAASAGAPSSSEVVAAGSTSEAPVPSEAAAAWENWQHIRDSVMTTQSTSALADAVAEVVQTAIPGEENFTEPQSSPETPSTPEPGAPPLSVGQSGSVELSETPTDASPLESESLSSIVDSVLAELKPRLMEQIAKKLKSEKK